ncbi:RNA-directed DNA polymerase, eukaryota, reverse transcriptase zinc-binding domain protein [Tanacetum coccineum]
MFAVYKSHVIVSFERAVYNMGIHVPWRTLDWYMDILNPIFCYELSRSVLPLWTLWEVCSQYGKVVDSFIPNRRAKSGEVKKDKGHNGSPYSYAHVVQTGSHHQSVKEDKPAIVLDDSCFNQCDFSLALMGRVKEFSPLSNLKLVLADEGFENIQLKYLGGYWVMIEFLSKESKDKFMANVVVPDFVDEDEINRETDDEAIDGGKQEKKTEMHNLATMEGESDVEEVPDTIFENVQSLIHQKDDLKDGQSDIHSEDPFNIYEILNKKQPNANGGTSSDDNLKYPLGFTTGDVVIMGDFNEVRRQEERYGSLFNARGADIFNGFISNAGLEDVPLGGSSFTWCHKSASKMSKLDPFLISESLMTSCPGISAITLDRYLSNHRPILLRESHTNYGLVPFRFFHFWFEIEGFDKFVETTWNDIHVQEPDAMRKLLKKIKYLKEQIRVWIQVKNDSSRIHKKSLKEELVVIDALLDNGDGTSEILNKYSSVLNSIQELDKLESMEVAQKTKIRWAIEGDENSKYYHGILNKKRSQLAIRGILAEGIWIEDPNSLKSEFLSHFKNRFEQPKFSRIHLDMEFPNKLSLDQQADLESMVTRDEIKRVVWDCGIDKSPGPDGFGKRWRGWIQSCLTSSRGSVMVNGSPTREFQFYKGLKQGDPLSPFLFILIMEKLHISVQRVVDAGMLRGITLGPSLQISHLFYVDDAVFMGRWCESNIDTITQVLACFYRASGLRINMNKSKPMGISVDYNKVEQATAKIGCATLKAPFSYLGSTVGGSMSRIQSWNEIMTKVDAQLSKWKMKTLSIGGRLTLLKSVLGAIPIYHMSLFKVPKKVLQRLESIRCHFFHGVENNKRKPIWVKWSEVLASIEKVGLGVPSFFALNRAILFKWVWRFRTQNASLWAKVIKGIYGNDGKLGSIATHQHPSIWLDIVHEVESLKQQGIDLSGFIRKKVSKGNDTLFWEDVWKGEVTFKLVYPRIYVLDSCKNDTVAVKLSRVSMDHSFRRAPGGRGIKQTQFNALLTNIDGIILADMTGRKVWTLEGSGEFSVASIRRLIDKRILPEVSTKTRWITGVPIKVNIHAWKVKLDFLPTRLNISRRGMIIDSILCHICEKAVESSSHTFFVCHIARDVFCKINRWWDISFMEVSSYEEWLNWLLNLRLHSKHKHLLEGVCYISWWLIWTFRNKTIFDLDPPSQSSLFEDVVARSFNWCRYRVFGGNFDKNWREKMANPSGNGLNNDVEQVVDNPVGVSTDWTLDEQAILEDGLNHWYPPPKNSWAPGEILWIKGQGFESRLLPTPVGAPLAMRVSEAIPCGVDNGRCQKAPRYASESNIIRYAKIAVQLQTKTVRDVALRCRWMVKRDISKRRKEEFLLTRKNKDRKEKMIEYLASTSLANQTGPSYFHGVVANGNTNAIQHSVLVSPVGQLLKESAQALDRVSANLETQTHQVMISILVARYAKQDPNEDRIVKGKEIDDEDLSKPFKEALKTPFTRRIIEFSGPEYSMPTNIALYNGSTDPADHLNRFVGAANSGEWPMPVWCRMFQQTLDGSARGWFESLPPNSIDECKVGVETGFIIGVPEVMKISSFMDSVKSPELAKRFASNVPKTVNEMMKRSRDVHQRLTFPAARRDDRDGRNSPGKDFRKGDYRSSYKVRDNFNTGRHRDYRAPYPQREHTNRPVPVLSLDSLTKCPKEILATETQLQLPPPRPVANPLRTGDPDKYCDYHQDKGHHTNDCIQLRKQLEIALESGRLNHLMKDLRQRVERRQNRNPPVQKVINMVNVHSSKKKKRKDREATESWMNTPISFPPIMTDDASDEPAQ